MDVQFPFGLRLNFFIPRAEDSRGSVARWVYSSLF